MALRLPVSILLTCLFTSASADAGQVQPRDVGSECPCERNELCDRIQTPATREVFGFSVAGHANAGAYDLTRLTTIAWNTDPQLMCRAHEAGTRVVMAAPAIPDGFLEACRSADLTAWIETAVGAAESQFLDGINFDLEIPMTRRGREAMCYVELVRNTTAAFHRQLPGSQVSLDIAWSPGEIDGRDYPWLELADAVDLVFVMAYDMQSQVFGRCIAGANSPLEMVRKGLQLYLHMGMDPAKMVLGLPWYGYRYHCQMSLQATLADAELCSLRPFHWRGVSCSDAVGSEICYSDIQNLLNSTAAADAVVRRDPTQYSPYFTFAAPDSDGTLQTQQVWFDDPRSLRAKLQLAVTLRLRGVGVWNLDCLDYHSNDPHVQRQSADMLATFDAFLHPASSHQQLLAAESAT